MTVNELEQATQETSPYFFTRDTMKFFGDTMANYGVRSAVVNTWTQENVEVWELYRKRAVKHNMQNSTYFNKETFKRVHKKG